MGGGAAQDQKETFLLHQEASVVHPFSPGGSLSLKMIVALLGKFAVAGSFGVVYLYAAELFPTQVRCVCVCVRARAYVWWVGKQVMYMLLFLMQESWSGTE